MYETIDVQAESSVATIWLNRPEQHNAFNAVLITELVHACEALGESESVRVVVLAGRGRSFSAGGDLNWMLQASKLTDEENLDDARMLARMLKTLACLPKPTIARVHGAAMGGGLGLTAACDICVASTGASFATSEVRLGLIPAAISPYVVRAIGARQAYRYFQTAERIPAVQAMQLGLVHEVVEPDQLDVKIQALTDALIEGAPQAQSEAKQLIRSVTETESMDKIIEETAQRIARIRVAPEAQEGVTAFLEKRPAAWVAASLAQASPRSADPVPGDGS
jgi:methylglutaconyl-CoA hydratase